MDRLRSRVRAIRHVLLLGLGIASQEDAGYAVAQENGHQVVVGLRVESSPGGEARTSTIGFSRVLGTLQERSTPLW